MKKNYIKTVNPSKKKLYAISSDHDSGRRPSVHQKGEREQCVTTAHVFFTCLVGTFFQFSILIDLKIHLRQGPGYIIP